MNWRPWSRRPKKLTRRTSDIGVDNHTSDHVEVDKKLDDLTGATREQARLISILEKERGIYRAPIRIRSR